jgi:hypothetical protein
MTIPIISIAGIGSVITRRLASGGETLRLSIAGPRRRFRPAKRHPSHTTASAWLQPRPAAPHRASAHATAGRVELSTLL